ncbi:MULTISPECIES: TIGR02679 domain-containing protein [Actinotignum]|uniref:TIGR02679 domain-containing protein n=1 Tax=Actinotignum TaxID=1653174 RepID=UPI00254A836D|nr:MULTISPECIES: TIGR02679 domain-containing protein [Actinotignum]MDE1536129.1 TIGR02679 domain-containing protein [Actinotignum schaalii]MDK7270934.1 TIGR02679 domain-containing protein [Actinotignum schaalii]MDY5150011.1 TIGR02679 domain-containing protein [Actinotignum timonense]
MIPAHILEWANLPGPRKLLGQAREKIEKGKLAERSQLGKGLTDAERIQVERLTPAGWARGHKPLQARQLRASLRDNGADLEELLVYLGGPLRDITAEKEAAREHVALDRAAGTRILQGLGIAQESVILSILGRAPSWRERAEEIAAVIHELPRFEGQLLSVLAAGLFSDAHALDRSRPLGQAVARTAAALGAEPYLDPLADAAAWHQAWAGVGITCDGVSSQVLVLNLPLVGEAPAARLAAVQGEPVWLTLRSLGSGSGAGTGPSSDSGLGVGAGPGQGSGLRLRPGISDVYVCENPSIIETAADRFGPASRPLICTYGNLSQAAVQLLTQLSACARLHVRADGDAAGWGFVRKMLELPHTTTWRMPEGESRYEEELIEELMSDLAL